MGETYLGVIARLSDALAEAFDLKEPAFFAELDWTALVELASPGLARTYQTVSRYPIVDRDIAVVVGRGQAAGVVAPSSRRQAASVRFE